MFVGQLRQSEHFESHKHLLKRTIAAPRCRVTAEVEPHPRGMARWPFYGKGPSLMASR